MKQVNTNDKYVGRYIATTYYGVGDSHLIKFYKIIKATQRSFWFVEVESKIVDRIGNIGHFDEIQMVVASDTVLTNEVIVRRRIGMFREGVQINDNLYGYVWDGEAKENYNTH